jgi:hypothetical protein
MLVNKGAMMQCPLTDPRRYDRPGENMLDDRLGRRCSNVGCCWADERISVEERPESCLVRLLTTEELDGVLTSFQKHKRERR